MRLPKYLILFMCFSILWRLWAMPRGFPFPFNFLDIIGLNRTSFFIVIIYIIWHLQKYGKFSIPSIGLKYYFLIFPVIIISFFYNGFFTSSFDNLLSSESSLSLKVLIVNGIGFMLIFVFALSYHRTFSIFVNFLLYGSSIFLLVTMLNVDQAFVNLFGGGSIQVIKTATESYYNIDRSTFSTLDDNNFGPIVSSLAMIAYYKYIISINKKEKLFYGLFIVISMILVIKTISRSTMVILILEFGGFIYLNFRATSLKGKMNYIYMLVISIVILIPNLSNDYFLALFDRFDEIISNVSSYSGSYYNKQIYDNYHGRLILAILSLPDNAMGWFLGNGGILERHSFTLGSYSHIDFTNWIAQWGLAGLILLMSYCISLLKFLWTYRPRFVENSSLNKKLFYMRNLAIVLLIGMLVMMLNSPLFFLLYFILGIATCIVIILKRHNNNSAINSERITHKRPLSSYVV
jgi:hypothetical protein